MSIQKHDNRTKPLVYNDGHGGHAQIVMLMNGTSNNDNGEMFSASNGADLLRVTATERALISLQGSDITLKNTTIFSEDRNAAFSVIVGGSVTGATWESTAGSSMVGKGGNISGGIRILSGYVPGGMFTHADIDYDASIFTIVAMRIGNRNTDMSAAVQWIEH